MAKVVPIQKLISGKIIIEISKRVILEDHIATKLRQDVANDDKKQMCRHKKDDCCAKSLEKDKGCLSNTEMTSLESLRACKIKNDGNNCATE